MAEAEVRARREPDHPGRQLVLPYEPSEHLRQETAHRVNGLLQSIVASVAIVRMTGAESERGGRAAAEILDRVREIGGLVAALAREKR